MLFLTVLMIKCGKKPDREESSMATISYNIREGKRLFLHYCAPCHGRDAVGSGRYSPTINRPLPTNFIYSDYLMETNEKVVFRAIKFGSKALGKSIHSPPYGNTLRDEEIRYIIEYLKFLKKSKEEES